MPRLREEKCDVIRLLPVVVLVGSMGVAVNAQALKPQIGGGTCSTSAVAGTYFYLLDGAVASNGQAVRYGELGKLVADGRGGVSGKSFSSVGGQQATNSLSGNYSVQANCSGNITLSVNSEFTTSLSFQVINNAQGMVVAISTATELVTGFAYRQTAGATPIQCGNGSLSGGYGYLLTGFAPLSGGSLYTDAGQFVSDGNGGGTVTSVANVGGNVSKNAVSGTYAVASDCSGTAQVNGPNGSLNYEFAIVRDGQSALFFSTDPGWSVAGVFTPQFTPAQNSVANGASFQAKMVSPGSLFSIFGTSLSAQPAFAGSVPLPISLGGTQVLVNGTPAPLLYVGDNQVNVQMPINVPIGQPVTFAVTNAGTPSNSVTLNLLAASPGFFTLDGTEAVVENPNGSQNSVADPAHPGDVLVAFLTGGGDVNPSGPWITGEDSPGGASSVRAQYSLTVGGHQADVQYVGLAPGFVGLYQANFELPTLSPGTYSMVLTIGGVSSKAATVVVGG